MKRKLKIMIFVLLSVFSLQFSAYAESDITIVEKPFLEGKYDRAVYEAGRLIDGRARQRYEIYYLKGLSELKLNRFKEARQSFYAIISKYPSSNRFFDAYVGIGDSYLLEGNIEGAIKAYNEIKEKFPSDKNIALVDSRLSECSQKTTYAVLPASTENKVEGSRDSKVVQNEISQGQAVLQPSSKSTLSPVETSKGYISVQVGCFKSERNANSLSAKLAARGYRSYVELPLVAGDRLYKVKVGRMKSRSEAENLAAKLHKDGYNTKICDDSSSQ